MEAEITEVIFTAESQRRGEERRQSLGKVYGLLRKGTAFPLGDAAEPEKWRASLPLNGFGFPVRKKKMNRDIERAIEEFRRRAAGYAKNERYYRGDHDLAFATEKFENAFGSLFREFALNLCPAVCDAVKDKLRVTRFGVEGDAGVEGRLVRSPHVSKRSRRALPHGRATDIRSDADRIWHANRMGVRAGEVHKEALKNGDAYLIVAGCGWKVGDVSESGVDVCCFL